VTGVWNTADMAGWTLSNQFYVNNLPLVTGVWNTADMAGWTLSYQFYVNNLPLVTGVWNTADMAGWTLSYQFVVNNLPLVTGVWNTADMAGWTLSNRFYVNNLPLVTWTIAAVDMDAGWATVDRIEMIHCNLAATPMTNLLTGLYALKPTMTYTAPVLNISGASNATPGGTYQVKCPPTTDKELIYELANDSCGVGGPEFVITYNGGTAP